MNAIGPVVNTDQDRRRSEEELITLFQMQNKGQYLNVDDPRVRDRLKLTHLRDGQLDNGATTFVALEGNKVAYYAKDAAGVRSGVIDIASFDGKVNFGAKGWQVPTAAELTRLEQAHQQKEKDIGSDREKWKTGQVTKGNAAAGDSELSRLTSRMRANPVRIPSSINPTEAGRTAWIDQQAEKDNKLTSEERGAFDAGKPKVTTLEASLSNNDSTEAKQLKARIADYNKILGQGPGTEYLLEEQKQILAAGAKLLKPAASLPATPTAPARLSNNPSMIPYANTPAKQAAAAAERKTTEEKRTEGIANLARNGLHLEPNKFYGQAEFDLDKLIAMTPGEMSQLRTEGSRVELEGLHLYNIGGDLYMNEHTRGVGNPIPNAVRISRDWSSTPSSGFVVKGEDGKYSIKEEKSLARSGISSPYGFVFRDKEGVDQVFTHNPKDSSLRLVTPDADGNYRLNRFNGTHGARTYNKNEAGQYEITSEAGSAARTRTDPLADIKDLLGTPGPEALEREGELIKETRAGKDYDLVKFHGQVFYRTHQAPGAERHLDGFKPVYADQAWADGRSYSFDTQSHKMGLKIDKVGFVGLDIGEQGIAYIEEHKADIAKLEDGNGKLQWKEDKDRPYFLYRIGADLYYSKDSAMARRLDSSYPEQHLLLEEDGKYSISDDKYSRDKTPPSIGYDGHSTYGYKLGEQVVTANGKGEFKIVEPERMGDYVGMYRLSRFTAYDSGKIRSAEEIASRSIFFAKGPDDLYRSVVYDNGSYTLGKAKVEEKRYLGPESQVREYLPENGPKIKLYFEGRRFQGMQLPSGMALNDQAVIDYYQQMSRALKLTMRY